MSSSKILILCSIFCALGLLSEANVPVLIWDLERAPLKGRISEEQFSGFVNEILSDSMLVVFKERQLEVEDLTRCQFEYGEKCYKYVESKKPVYYPSIPNPVQILKDSTDNFDFVELKNDGSLENKITYEPGKVAFIDFEGVESNVLRTKTLATHDDLISKVYPSLAKMGKVVAMYTGDEEYLLRRVRQAAEEKPETRANTPSKKEGENPGGPDKPFAIDNKFLMYWNNLTLIELKQEGDKKKLEGHHINIVNKKLTEVEEKEYKVYNVDLSGDGHTIELAINISKNGFWQLTSLSLDNQPQKINETIEVSGNLSYYCSNYSFGLKNKYLQWDGLQFQPRFNLSSEEIRFEDAWHCVGFTSPAIWSGLFVVFMMLLIVAIGVCWMMDINTNDRFDDPKGKTITVTASE